MRAPRFSRHWQFGVEDGRREILSWCIALRDELVLRHMLRHRSVLETDECQRLDFTMLHGHQSTEAAESPRCGRSQRAKGPKEREARCNGSLPARRNPLQACTPAPRNVISVGLGFHRHFGDHLAGAKKVLLVEALNGWMVGRLDELDGEHVLVRVRHRHTANCLPTAVGTYSSSNG